MYWAKDFRGSSPNNVGEEYGTAMEAQAVFRV